MLEFIVLGEIPGTSIQIDFKQFVQIGFLLLAIVLIGVEMRIRKINTPKLQEILNRLSL